MSDLYTALPEIHAIRGQLARGAEFRGYAPAMVAATGALVLVAAAAQAQWLSSPAREIGIYLAIWIGIAVVSLTVISLQTVTRARRVHSDLPMEMIHSAVEQFLPAIVAGVLLTVVLWRCAPQTLWMLPGLWQVLFSLGVFASCQFLTHDFRMPPAVALYRPGSYELFVEGDSADWSKGPPAIWFEDLDAAALLLALTPTAAPAEAAHWFHNEDPDVARFAQMGIRRYAGDLQIAPFRSGWPLTVVTSNGAAGTMTAFQRLSGDDRDRVKLALQRLIRSRNQMDVGNRAIDLAIALEVLFMNADRDEHSYKIATRLSKLLCADAAERSVAFLETRRLYDVRSKVVQAGRITKNQWNVGTEKRDKGLNFKLLTQTLNPSGPSQPIGGASITFKCVAH